MAQSRPLNETELWLLNLERERTDLSYLNPKPVHVESVFITKNQYPKRAEMEKYGQRMFAAGRYAAGARDKVAVAANKWLEKELDL